MYLWIDPGIRKLWYGLIDENAQVVLSWVILQDNSWTKRKDQFWRMVEIYQFFSDLLQKYPIQAVWMERLFFTTRNQSNAEFVYGARWVLWMLFASHTLPLYEWTPQEIKKYVSWNGSASKELMLAVVRKIFSLNDKELAWHDAADALWIALMVKNSIVK